MNDDFLCVGYALGHTCGVKVQKVQKVQRVVVAAEAADYKKSRPAPPSFRPKRSGVEKSPPSDGTGGIGAGDLQAQSIIGTVSICPPYRHAAPLEMTKEPCHPTVMLKRKTRLAPESLAVRCRKKKPLISRSFFFISQEIRIHSSGIRMLRHRSRYRCLWSLRRSCIRRGVLRS